MSFVRTDGWTKFSTWDHSAQVAALYRRRCLLEEPEMTCHTQAVELLAPIVSPKESLLDVGCGSGYFFHAQKKLSLEYFGIDASPALLAVGRDTMPSFGLPAERLTLGRIEDLDASVDHIVCINVVTNIDNYHKPLERMLLSARKSVILRESFAPEPSCQYVRDDFLDTGVSLKVYVNTYKESEVQAFVESYGFKVDWVIDLYTKGQPQDVIGYPHFWKFMVATKEDCR